MLEHELIRRAPADQEPSLVVRAVMRAAERDEVRRIVATAL
jgi:hypothetical protein